MGETRSYMVDWIMGFMLGLSSMISQDYPEPVQCHFTSSQSGPSQRGSSRYRREYGGLVIDNYSSYID